VTWDDAGGRQSDAAPRVSVVIPTYNCAPWLRESLDSVLAQTVGDLEVVVVDDGSTDETSTILESYSPRVEVVRGDHGGLSAARNLGLTRARGEWIAFHDADDVALPDRLEFQLDFLHRHPECDAAFCNGERMESPTPAEARLVSSEHVRRCAGRFLTAADLFRGYPVYFQGALVPRAAFERVGPFDVTLPIQPDI
jgi:glycosyltransferase involved in cell wall biosynthesis